MAVRDLDRVKLAEMDIKAGETSVVLPEASLKLFFATEPVLVLKMAAGHADSAVVPVRVFSHLYLHSPVFHLMISRCSWTFLHSLDLWSCSGHRYNP